MKIKIISLFLLTMTMLIGLPQAAHAAACSSRSIIGIGSWDKYLACDATNDNAIVDFSFPSDVLLIALATFDIIIRLAVLISVGIIIYAGFKFMLAQGNPEKIQEAKTIIQDALIGLAISILAATIVNFIASGIT